ncbi:MAG: hypothetical protein HC895_17100 [Leptolyngbyaceae cyanobacterium SM1_3_5]|nr:hypothetical protein [Leptolyngbyaceae cyanobacterium SM1_3_5]
MWVTSSLATAKTPTIAALGNFDGVHRGHRQVIEPIVSAASAEFDFDGRDLSATSPKKFF